MTFAFLQPPEVDPDTGEIRDASMRAKLDAARAERDEMLKLQRSMELAKQAEQNLFFREANRLTDELEWKRSGAADSWAPISIGDLWDTEQQRPEVGSFDLDSESNGGGVFYRGKVNEVHGQSESGKTMLLLAVAAQEVRAGNNVIMIDFEDDGRAIANRLRYVFGLTREEAEKHFHYFRPSEAFNERGMQAISNVVDPSFCIIDAVTESMSIAGLNGREENDVATWYNTFPKKIAELGPAVALVDHTPQGVSERAIGSQHKKAAIDGVSYSVEVVHPMIKGQSGQLRILVAKDKIGSIRAEALPQGEGRQYWRGDLHIDSSAPNVPAKVRLRGVVPTLFQVNEEGVAVPGRTTEHVPDISALEEKHRDVLVELAEWADGIQPSYITDALNKGREKGSDGYWGRTTARSILDKVLRRQGLVEPVGAGVWKVTGKGRHAANAVALERSRDPQLILEIDNALTCVNTTDQRSDQAEYQVKIE